MSLVDTRNCDVCGQYLLSNANLLNHMEVHGKQTFTIVSVVTAIPLEYDKPSHACPVCRKVCKSEGELERNFKFHGTTAFLIDKQQFDCQLCHKKCYSLAGLKSHLRAHERNN